MEKSPAPKFDEVSLVITSSDGITCYMKSGLEIRITQVMLLSFRNSLSLTRGASLVVGSDTDFADAWNSYFGKGDLASICAPYLKALYYEDFFLDPTPEGV